MLAHDPEIERHRNEPQEPHWSHERLCERADWCSNQRASAGGSTTILLLLKGREINPGNDRRGLVFRHRRTSVHPRRAMGAMAAMTLATAVLIGWQLGGTRGEADSIAVLPFTNVGNDSALAYLADGVPEEITNTLARVRGVEP